MTGILPGGTWVGEPQDEEPCRRKAREAGRSRIGRMSLVSTTAFILKLDPLSEKDLVAAVLTKDHGVVRAAVRGARGKSKRAGALQLLTEVSLTYFRREGADLARVDGLEIVTSAFDLASRAETAMLLPYLEIGRASCRERV
jgi:Recombinational DNA repair protein (RecF pathway)